MPTVKLKIKKNRIPGAPPIRSTLTKKQAREELTRLARAQKVKPYTRNSFRDRFPSLSEPGTWDGFEDFIRELHRKDANTGSKSK
jgi:hypothetical protein